SWSSLNKANWVDWERDNGKEYNSANAKYTRDADGHFYAKVYDPDEEKIYAIAVTRSGNNNNRRYKYGRATSQSANTGNYYYNEDRDYGQINSNMTSLTNNHMYVIQLTSTSDEYAVGKPTVVNNLSDDQVVSPAFMIASQLGANTPFNNDINGAANLCGSYMEVGTDGTRYTGWRLPTRDEVGFIVKYQNDPEVENRNMQKVMTGTHYWTLEGKAVATGAYVVNNTTYWYNDYATRYKDTQYDATSGNVRCLRDLTLEELNKLNGTTTN
ncbi:MAG: hypothetical protein IJ636_00035, partial [Bacteroidales bacterium]|nr:hypothetical protein [Bacteroidales bacterium]